MLPALVRRAAASGLIALALGTNIPAFAASCNSAAIAAAQIPSGTYSPFDPAATTGTFAVTIKNNESSACTFALAFFRNPTSAKLGGALAYIVKNDNVAGGHSLFTNSNPPSPWYLTNSIAANASATLYYDVVIAAGQVVAPGTYMDSFELRLNQIGGGGSATGHTLATQTIAPSYTVGAVMSVNIAGGGQTTTLDFGALATGAMRSVNIQARSNQGYKFKATSDNGGVMKLTPPAADGLTWEVPYTVKINHGAAISLSSTYTLTISSGATTVAGTNVPVEVTLGNPAGKRAGTYKDVITIKIEIDP
ncbi:MAG: hypothetical protein ACREC6_10105 [Hyphomicrobiaceae bacterium]